MAFLKPWSETRNIWVKKTAEPFATARRVTAETKRPIPGFSWTRDSRLILYVKDNDGDENFNVWAVDPGGEGKDVPPSRNLTDAKKARAFIYAVPKKTPDTIYVGLNDRDAAWHDLYRLSISTGKREVLRKNTDRISGWIFDLEGTLRLATRTMDDGGTEVLKVEPDAFKAVYTCDVFETCYPDRFHRDGKRVYMQTNKGATDLVQLVLLDPETGAEETVDKDPLGRVDLGGTIFAEATDELAGTAYEDERTRVYLRDPAWKADYEMLRSRFPGRDINLVSSTADDSLWLVAAASDVDPGEVHLFDRGGKKPALQYKVRERIPREHMAEMKPVRYPSSDGLEVPAFLTLPKGVPPKNLPAILLPHGGPWARDGWGFDNLAQFLANRGYAVLQPNFRGSTGYGKKFLNAGNQQWGDKMQDDVTWGARFLAAQGTVGVPKAVASLSPGSASYQAKIEAGGQTIPMSITQTIEDKGASWVVTGTAKMPMGDAVDVTTFDKTTLVPRKRSIKQGPATIELAFAGGKATGTVAIGGAPKAVSVDLGGDLFADGVGAYEAIGALPLAAGYSTTFRNFDVRQQKVELKQAKVAGAEAVTVPAGTFRAWKVEIASAEGAPGSTTVWIAKDSRKVVKTVSTVPEMGGAVVTTELQP